MSTQQEKDVKKIAVQAEIICEQGREIDQLYAIKASQEKTNRSVHIKMDEAWDGGKLFVSGMNGSLSPDYIEVSGGRLGESIVLLTELIKSHRKVVGANELRIVEAAKLKRKREAKK